MITRRNLLTGLAAFIAAPAIIRVADLMPIKAWARERKIFQPLWELTSGDTLSLTFDMVDYVKGDEIRFNNAPSGIRRLQVNAFDSRNQGIVGFLHFDGVPTGTFIKNSRGKFVRSMIW